MNNPALKIDIYGHTDNFGDEEYNYKLSEKRALAVYDYLVDKGIDPSRLSCKGFGSDVPIAGNESEDERGKNRRVEFKIREK